MKKMVSVDISWRRRMDILGACMDRAFMGRRSLYFMAVI
jgi:hypothetical protein